MTALALRHVRYAYGERRALAGVSLTVEPGELVGLVGPNGSGKTTLLKLAAGILAGEGEVTYGGRALASMTARSLAAARALVPQDEGDPFPYRVDEMVAMGLAHRHRFYAAPRPDAQVTAALREVGYEGELGRRYDALSGGERQLVRLARALVQAAGLMLLDEPTSHLDLRHRAAIVRALKTRVQRGAAVLWSVHDIALAASACDRLVLLKGGRLVASGPPALLTAELLHEVYGVALLVGRHPVAGTPTVDLDPSAWL